MSTRVLSDDLDVVARACRLLMTTYEIDAIGAADVLRVCACAVGLDARALAERVVRGVGTNDTPSHFTLDALLMDVD
jgi:hypothetical protein